MDLPNIGLVVHWNAAPSYLDFVQQIGRAGRDGKPCICITMYDRADCQRQERFARKATDPQKRDFELSNMQKVCFSTPNSRQQIVMSTLPAPQVCVCMQIHRWYEQTTICRHVHLESVFGDQATSSGQCGTRCDHCRQEQLLAAIVSNFEDEHA
jgi:ATP-dependent DNA helicase RecQ